MINLPKLEDLDVSGKKVIIRADLDLGEDIQEGDEVKLKTIVPTLSYLIEKKAKLILIGHRGRPSEENEASLSLNEVARLLSKLVQKNVSFIDDIVGEKTKEEVNKLGEGEIVMLENLRFDSREESNDEGFAKEISALGDVYVNEAFSASHRNHSSIVGIPKNLAHAAGFRFVAEIEHLTKIFDAPKRPVVMLISGVKEDKLAYVTEFAKFADKILIGGRLPEYIEKIPNSKLQIVNEKLVVANLVPDKEDITIHSMEKFEEIIKNAGTIVVSGPLGKFEDEGHRQGTQRVFGAVTQSNAFKVAGGGDTEQAIALLGLTDKFDWVSVGGGAMLEFLAKCTLPGIEALL